MAMKSERAARDLAKGLMNIGFVVSAKSQLLTNSKKVEHVVQAALDGIGLHINVVDKAVDLGMDISNSLEGRRELKKRSARIKAADLKAGRIQRLHGANKRAHLWRTVSFAQASYAT